MKNTKELLNIGLLQRSLSCMDGVCAHTSTSILRKIASDRSSLIARLGIKHYLNNQEIYPFYARLLAPLENLTMVIKQQRRATEIRQQPKLISMT